MILTFRQEIGAAAASYGDNQLIVPAKIPEICCFPLEREANMEIMQFAN